MDFVEALPKVNGKSVILTVVDRLSKAAHFIPLGHPYSVTSVAHAFFAEIVRLHEIPVSISVMGIGSQVNFGASSFAWRASSSK
jgi:hypothetical protein